MTIIQNLVFETYTIGGCWFTYTVQQLINHCSRRSLKEVVVRFQYSVGSQHGAATLAKERAQRGWRSGEKTQEVNYRLWVNYE